MATQRKKRIPAHMMCRTFGHAWFLSDLPHNVKVEVGQPITLQCERCDMLRVDRVDNRGDVMGRRYIDQSEYYHTKDDTSPRWTRTEWRARFMMRRGYDVDLDEIAASS